MKKFYTLLIALCALQFTPLHTRSSLSRLNKIYVGNSKKIRRCINLKLNPKSTGDVYIAKESKNKHAVTAMEPGVAIIACTKKDGTVEEKAVKIEKASSRPRANVSFRFGYRPRGYYYISSDPFYTPWGGWGPYWNRPYYNYYW